MQKFTTAGQNVINDVAQRYNLSSAAVEHMLIAVNNGGGSMAQFNCPELGGSGQWMSGGMTMVGDMFNHGLKATVDNLCGELSNALSTMQVLVPLPQGSMNANNWWPGDLGHPSSSGAQNNTRYAVFPHRLAVEVNGQVTIYDTLDHNIGGVSQQQGGDLSLKFNSQHGTLNVNSLPVLSGSSTLNQPLDNFVNPPEVATQPNEPETPRTAYVPQAEGNGTATSTNTILDTIDRLAKLRDSGALTDLEYNAKKNELLARV